LKLGLSKLNMEKIVYFNEVVKYLKVSEYPILFKNTE
jgi:hypothetical protein